MDVAMARMKNSPRSMRSAGLPSPSPASSRKASQSILPPMTASSTKATQWSMGPMMPKNWLPSAQPMSGMSAWNPPKTRASTTAILRLTSFMPRPLQMDTANASMERPTAMSSSSTRPI